MLHSLFAFYKELKLLFHILADAGEVGFHGFAVVALDDVKKFSHLRLDFHQLLRGVGVEEYLADKVIVFRHETACYLHVAFEGCARRFLMLHHSGKCQCGGKGYGERIGYGLQDGSSFCINDRAVLVYGTESVILEPLGEEQHQVQVLLGLETLPPWLLPECPSAGDSQTSCP